VRTKKARHLLSHTAANPPPTLPFWEQRRPLPARSEEKERGRAKDHLERHVLSTQLLPIGRPKG